MPHKIVIKGRPDYYKTPTHDFTQYTKDSEEKYWSQATKFDWSQRVEDNLQHHLDNLDAEAFSRITFMVLPMIEEGIGRKITLVQQKHLPVDEDALKDIDEGISFDKKTIQKAFAILEPLNQFLQAISTLKDQLEILENELWDVKEQQRLGLFRGETEVRRLEKEEERKEQIQHISQLSQEIKELEREFKNRQAKSKSETDRLKAHIRDELNLLEPQILIDLKDSQELLRRILDANQVPEDPTELAQLKDLILKRQLRGLKDIANHALVVEQSAIAPLSMGIIHYKRYREIQEAMTTFINDEAKHSATFRRFLAEKLGAKEFINSKLISGAKGYMWVARFMPSAGMFLAVIVEAIGAAYLEFFGEDEYMPDSLFCSISKTISNHDEKRHMDLCVGIYNELFRKGTRWERFRNKTVLTVMMRSVYGDKTEDHHLIQAFRAFGVASETLYQHIANRLSYQLARAGLYLQPGELLSIIKGR